MADSKTTRLSKAAKNFNVGIGTIVEKLESLGFEIDRKPNAPIPAEQYALLEKEFKEFIEERQEAEKLTIGTSHHDVVIDTEKKPVATDDLEDELFIEDRTAKKEEKAPQAEPEAKKEEISTPEEDDAVIKAKLQGLKIVGKVDLDNKNRPVAKAEEPEAKPEKPEPEVEPTPAPVAEEAPEAKEEVVEEEAAPETPKKEPEEVKAEVKAPVGAAEPEVKDPKKEGAPKEIKEEVQEQKEEKPDVPKEKPVVAEEKIEKAKEEEATPKVEAKPEIPAPEMVNKVEEKDPVVDKAAEVKQEEPSTEEAPTEEATKKSGGSGLIKAKSDKLPGLTVLGTIDLSSTKKPKKKGKPEPRGKGGDQKDAKKDIKKEESTSSANQRKRKRVKYKSEDKTLKADFDKENKGRGKATPAGGGGKRKDRPKKEEPSKEEVQAQYKKTLAKLSGPNTPKSNKSKYRREKRDAHRHAEELEQRQASEEVNVLKVAEFISTNELSSLMEVSVNDIIGKCMGLGMFVSINQRLDAETIKLIAEDFGFDVEFTSAEEETDLVLEEEDKVEDLSDRAPIVTIMGHVDHGKTSLLDYIREAKVAAGEAGGITQHIGAYDVVTESNRRIVFLDTPGHEAFTAMRARGAKVTDVVIVVVAADDSVMPQTIEAINHAQVAGVPIVIAINKVDKPTANPDKIKQELSNINILVEEWGGSIQSQEISAKTGQGIDDLLELVLLESDILELKANSKKNGVGTVVEAFLDKGRGYVSTVLVQGGTLKVGDIILAGQHQGRVKALTDSRGKRVKKVGPATPVQVLGLNGAPQAGDKFNVMTSEREAKDIAVKRQQIMREQSIRATKRTTLSDIGRRIALGNFQQLNVILKGDVDGSVEALSDSLQKLSTDEVEVNIIHKAVGPVSENDILLASASDAIVIGFQVRPTLAARRLAEKEDVEVRLYSIIYNAIEEVKDAMEGLLSAEIKEEIVGNVEVRETYKISKVGMVAGCYVLDGYLKRNSKIRLIRDGIVVYGGGENGGEIAALKRFKDDVSEVKQGFECGLSIKNFNDIKVGDIVEAFETREVKRTLN
ncbi:translation initiation factor IF-2 [Flammeovirgaceae bacterium SG7u.111]|nr:translation initiation factor IF-2 [Flammeovirgaceae bacterium SG7u.132]WPO36516.1 translation initiation factor IF-2 [Flammeovirgaceae bacterium SG7u.111]